MATPSFTLKAITAKLLSSVTARVDDVSQDVAARLGRYAGLVGDTGAPTRHALSDEGSYLLAVTSTISGGQFQPASSVTVTPASPAIYLYNTEPSYGKTLFLDYFKVVFTLGTGSAGGVTTGQYAVQVDPSQRSILTNPGGLTQVTATSESGSLATVAPLILYSNSNSISTLSTSSALAQTRARGSLFATPALFDYSGSEAKISFGTSDVGVSNNGASTSVLNANDVSAPVVLPPGYSASMYVWNFGSHIVGRGDFELGMWAR